jgi:hypothetical protein
MPDYSNHTPTSRTEMILKNMVDGTEITLNPQSAVEYLLIQLNDKIGPGGGSLKPAGSKSFESLGVPSEDELGNIYNITNDFVSNQYFIDGSGKSYKAGTNVYCIVQKDPLTEEDAYWWDIFGASIDLSDYLTKTEAATTYADEADIADIKIDIADLGISKIGISQVGIAGGVAGLDENGEIEGAETISALEVKTIWDSIPDPVRPSVIYESSSDLGSYTYEFDEDGLYLVMCGYPHSGSASITFSDAEIISEDAVEVTASGSVRGVLSKIARVKAGETVTVNLTWQSAWPGRVLSIVKLVGFDIDTDFETVKNVTADGYTTYTLPTDTDRYLVYGLGLSKSANYSKNETNGGSYKHIDGNWGYNSISMVALCKGFNSPLFKFHGYDGGLSAIFAWKIEA